MSKALSLLAFETLHNKLFQESTSVTLAKFNDLTESSALDYPENAPLFITWNKSGQLRGCIGTFQSLRIENGVKRFALTSALDDPRFPPITKKELPLLSVSVTLLDNFTPISLPLDWQIGLHGLKLQFEKNDEYYSGTFLPSVAEEQEWDHKTTLYYLLKKAGYDFAVKSKVIEFYEDGLQEGWIQLERYDGLKNHLVYDEFIKIRDKA
ncbi:hypothetical protein HYPBUDRAFT_152487 [Hyphopichia burtonii NRRL Y-1933]|uniref:AMMECR1 domain-containing protein n=1 Tax=Hyphopichia burtonii NRRL Y-1933 TaxID=984485 RepID=A0A1E4RKL7_9ASCO|nr:hypothetical protein HYPBUDRAFT_152487 [Hyphopichia burtonii NRRL Y-1933]ODV67625.1 hypothetical protein HYPBUDRAFT_152487 [Hyphopichia burtonii NRRL Y-1933]